MRIFIEAQLDGTWVVRLPDGREAEFQSLAAALDFAAAIPGDQPPRILVLGADGSDRVAGDDTLKP